MNPLQFFALLLMAFAILLELVSIGAALRRIATAMEIRNRNNLP